MRRGPRRRAVLLILLLAAASIRCGGEREAATGPTPAYASDGTRLAGARRAPNAPNLVLIVIDTLRHDALEPPGQPVENEAGPRMPFLKALAARGTHFTQATAPGSWTLPSMASLLTGLLPSEHGAQVSKRPRPVSSTITTYAEALSRGQGYQTAAFVAGGWMRPGSGVLQGFEHEAQDFMLQGVEDHVGEWAAKRDPQRPFFMLLHTTEAHEPYGELNHVWPIHAELKTPGALSSVPIPTDAAAMTRAFLTDLGLRKRILETRGQAAMTEVVRFMSEGLADGGHEQLVADIEDAYWAGVAWVDGLIADTCEVLRRQGLLDNTLLVVTSDHGEAFGEHGILGHGRQLHDELVRIPLVIAGLPPFDGGLVVDDSVGLIDVLPTLLDLAGAAGLDGEHGRSLAPLARAEGRGRPILSEETLSPDRMGRDADGIQVSARSRRFKYILTHDFLEGTVREEAYDLLVDPGELSSLADRDGRIPEGVSFDPAFCEAVDAIRARIWASIEADEMRSETPYASGLLRPEERRPAPCRSRVP